MPFFLAIRGFYMAVKRSQLRASGSAFLFDQGLGLDDREFVRERVKSQQEQAAGPGFDCHKAEWGQGETMVRLEIVQQAPFAAVSEDFIVHMQKNLGRQHLDLETGLIAYAKAGTDCVAAFAAQPIVEQA